MTIEREGDGIYVQSAKLGNRSLDRAWFFERDLKRGLKLRMGSEPSATWGTKHRPPSVTGARLDAFGC
jgi:putative alpha-1,2-mannosidase